MEEVLHQHTIASAASAELREVLSLAKDWPAGVLQSLDGAKEDGVTSTSTSAATSDEEDDERKDVEERHRQPEV